MILNCRKITENFTEFPVFVKLQPNNTLNCGKVTSCFVKIKQIQ